MENNPNVSLCYEIPLSNEDQKKKIVIKDVWNPFPEISDIRQACYLWQINAIHLPVWLADDPLKFFYVMSHEQIHELFSGTQSFCWMRIFLDYAYRVITLLINKKTNKDKQLLVPSLECYSYTSKSNFLPKIQSRIFNLYQSNGCIFELFSLLLSLLWFSNLDTANNKIGPKYLGKDFRKWLDWEKEADVRVSLYESRFKGFYQLWGQVKKAYFTIGYEKLFIIMRYALNATCDATGCYPGISPRQRLGNALELVNEAKIDLKKMSLKKFKNDLKKLLLGEEYPPFFDECPKKLCVPENTRKIREELDMIIPIDLQPGKFTESLIWDLCSRCKQSRQIKTGTIEALLIETFPQAKEGYYHTEIVHGNHIYQASKTSPKVKIKSKLHRLISPNMVFLEAIRQQLLMGDGLRCPMHISQCESDRHYQGECPFRQDLKQLWEHTEVSPSWKKVKSKPTRKQGEIRWGKPFCLT